MAATQLKSSILRYTDVPPEMFAGEVPEEEQAYRAGKWGPRHHLTLVRPKELKRVKAKDKLTQQLEDLPPEGMKVQPGVQSIDRPKKGRQYKFLPVKWDAVQELRKQHGLGRIPLHVTVGARETAARGTMQDEKTAMLKVAKEKKDEEKSKKRKSRAPLLAGLGAAGATGAGIYAAMRKRRLSSNPLLRKIQEGSGGKFVRSVSEKAPKGKLRRYIDRIRHSADEVVYTGGAQPKKPKKVRAAVHHFDPETETAWVRSATTPDPHSTRAASRLNELIGEDKLREAKYFERHAPGSFPKSEGVGGHVRAILKEMGLKKPPRGLKKQEEFVSKLQGRLQQEHGKGGFVLKDLGGAQSSGKFPMESDDFAKLWRDYRGGSSRKLREKLRQQGGEFSQSSDWDKFYSAAKKDPAYSGRVLEDIMRNPKSALSQQKVQFEKPGVLGRLASKAIGNPASSEIRVHSFAGQVDPGLATPRYDPTAIFKRKQMREASEFVQSVVDKLPKQHRNTSFAFDVAPVKGGGFKLIESNPMGARSGLLDPGKNPLMSPQLRRFYTGQYGQGISGAAALAGGGAAGGAVAGGTALGQHLAGRRAAQPAAQSAQPAEQAQEAPQQAAQAQQAVPPRRPVPVQQKAAAAPTGLYKGKPASPDTTKFKLDFQGIPIHVDRPRGFVMMGRDAKGKPWSRRYKYNYGHIPKTLGGDHDGLDVFIGPKKKAEHAYWAIQRKEDGSFDEYKVFLGFDNRDEAIAAYRAHIPKKLFSGLMTMRVEMMKAMLGKNPQQNIKVAMLLELSEIMEAKK